MDDIFVHMYHVLVIQDTDFIRKILRSVNPFHAISLLSVPPENIGKPDIFLIYSGVIARDQKHEMNYKACYPSHLLKGP